MNKKVRQRDITDCGAACLAAIAAHFGMQHSVAALRQYAGTDKEGTTVLGLIQCANQIGLTGKAVKGSFENFTNEILPAIVHIRLPQGLEHFVVLAGLSKKTVRIMDPRDGAFRQIPNEEFKSIWTGIAVLLAPSSSVAITSTNSTGEPRVGSRRVWDLVKPHSSIFLQSFIGALIASLLTLSTTIYVRNVVDHVIVEGNIRLLNLLSIATIAVLSVRAVLMWTQTRLHHQVILRIDAQLITDYHRHLLSLPQQFFDTMRSGEILTRVSDAIKVRTFLNDVVLQIAVNIFVLLFALIFLFFISFPLALGALTLMTLLAVLFVSASLFNRVGQQEAIEAHADFGAEISETLHAASTIKRLALERTAAIRTETKLIRSLRKANAVARTGVAFANFSSWMIQISLIVLLWAGTKMVLDSQLTAGDVLSSYTLGAFMVGPITALFGAVGSIHQAHIAAKRLFEIFDLEAERSSGILDIGMCLKNGLSVKSVDFAHPGRLPILRNVSMTFPAGKISVLTGQSGCGKSTILALLQRLYKPTLGGIYIDESNLELFALADIRSKIAVVPQKIELFSDTIIGNIVLADPTPDVVRATEICKLIGLHQFIDQLPLRYLTPVAEGGANLSGGQRQRLAIARVIYRESPVILMDEPSSALDTEAEDMLITALQLLRARGTTMIIAAHNPRLAEVADVVYHLDGGIAHQVKCMRPTGVLKDGS